MAIRYKTCTPPEFLSLCSKSSYLIRNEALLLMASRNAD